MPWMAPTAFRDGGSHSLPLISTQPQPPPVIEPALAIWHNKQPEVGQIKPGHLTPSFLKGDHANGRIHSI